MFIKYILLIIPFLLGILTLANSYSHTPGIALHDMTTSDHALHHTNLNMTSREFGEIVDMIREAIYNPEYESISPENEQFIDAEFERALEDMRFLTNPPHKEFITQNEEDNTATNNKEFGSVTIEKGETKAVNQQNGSRSKRLCGDNKYTDGKNGSTDNDNSNK